MTQPLRAVRLGLLAVLAAACGSSTSSSAAHDGGGGDDGSGGGDAAGGDTGTPPDGSVGAEAGAGDGGGPGDGGTGRDGGRGEGGAPDAGGAGGRWVLGYYSSWDEAAYPVSAIDWDGLTHVATAFYIPDGKGGWTSGSFDDPTAKAIIAAAHAHGKKAIASVGGASTGPGFEGSMQSARTAFLGNLAALVAMGYDGLDIDWEGGNLPVAQDQALETALVQAIRAQSPGIVITFTTGTENENSLDNLAFYGTLAAQVDQINLMSYGMAGAYSGWKSWHSSPLHWNKDPSTPTGIDATVAHYLAAGVPAAKLGVGSGFYGMCYTAPVTAPDQALSGSKVAASDNMMSYKNIMASYYAGSAYHYDSAAQVPFLTLSGAGPQKCTYVTYEDATSIAAKGAWVKAQGLGGTIIWTISEGYVASGATVQAQNPLLEAMKTAFLQ